MIDLDLLRIPLCTGLCLAFEINFASRRAKSYTPRDEKVLFISRYGIKVVFLIPLFFLVMGLEQRLRLNLLRVLTMTASIGLVFLLLPLLRKRLEAESCANLWSIPFFLFFAAGLHPRWTIPLPFPPISEQLWRTFGRIWLAGAVAVVLWSIVSHLLFRHRLLKNAKTVMDEKYFQVWLKQLFISNLPTDKIHFYTSPDTQTPLSIGLLWRTTCLVLPERDYTPEELEMVLQHELVHISRRDSLQKFLMCLLAAFMWFNPLVWIALRVCAQDLELSCDEAVLYGRTEEERMVYARLLLKNAPKPHGFTSCLSASATSLRYRLKNVVNSREKIEGGLLVGLMMFLILLGGMSAGVRYKAMPAKEMVFAESEIAQLEVCDDIFLEIDGIDFGGECQDAQRLLNYIADLSLQRTSEKPDLFDGTTHAQFTLKDSRYKYTLNFGGCYLRVYTVELLLSDEGDYHRTSTYYQLDGEPDWELLRACITPK